MKAVLTVFVLLVSVSAFASQNFECDTKTYGYTEKITGTIEDADHLSAVTVVSTDDKGKSFTYTAPMMVGKSDPWELSPQLGTRFYFHSGNTSDFMLFEDGVLQTARTAVAPAAFKGVEILEQYEQGGSQDIFDLSCRTLN